MAGAVYAKLTRNNHPFGLQKILHFHDLMPELVRHDCWYKTEKIGEEEHTKVASATGPTPTRTTTFSRTVC